jgi:hypothetical protein
VSAHTPGPWTFDAGEEGYAGVPIYAGGDPSRVVAIVNDENADEGVVLADARLIAAAPRMAEILLSAYQHVSHGGPNRGDVESVLREAGLIAAAEAR